MRFKIISLDLLVKIRYTILRNQKFGSDVVEIEIKTPLTRDVADALKAGDLVKISGVIYTARDAAHKRMCETNRFPVDWTNQIIYYAGPAPAPAGKVIGSCGPTTSGRMDAYAPTLIKNGLMGMIGKGERSGEVVQAMKEYGAVYFGAIGGAGALISKCVKAVEVVAYDDLGTEAIRALTVQDFPAVVVIDNKGRTIRTQEE